MNFFQRTAHNLVKRAAKYAGIPLRDPALVAMLGNQPTAAGMDVDEKVALNYAAFWQGVSLIASNVAGLPCAPFILNSQDRIEAKNHPSHRLLTVSPNDEMTPFLFVETLQGHATVWGNGYAYIEREADDPEAPVVAMWPMLPNQVKKERDDNGTIFYHFTPMYHYETEENYAEHEVLHICGFSYDGLTGYNVTQQARESLGLGMATERYGAAFFGRGSVPGGLLEAPVGFTLTEKARKNLRESFELLHRGPDNSHRVAILEDGITYKGLGVPPEVAQFLQTREFQVVEIARWLNIPPHLLRDLTRSTNNNIEQQGIDFLTYTLRPWLFRWQHEYRRKLLTPKEQDSMGFAHDARELLLTDIKSRNESHNVGRMGGWLSLNDILRAEKMPLLPPALGDSRLVPANMKAVNPQGFDALQQPEDKTEQVQFTAMNGAQIASLLQVVQAVAARTLDVDAAESMILLAFPNIDRAVLDGMMKPYRGVK